MTNKEPVSVSDEIQKMSFCVFDLETTGGNHKNDKIIEIGMVRIENLKVVKEASYLIQPEIHIPEFIQKLTSITPDDVSDSPKIEEVVDE
ncbi:MAG: DNA polymerase III epsilon subunit-like protein, partial [Bacteriovoracaceae bacterium]